LSRVLRWALVVCCICAAIALGAAAWYRLSQFDGAVERLAESAARGEFDEQRTAVLSLAINYIDHLLAERRALLMSGHVVSSPHPSQFIMSRRRNSRAGT
jgi:hypothetical protein